MHNKLLYINRLWKNTKPAIAAKVIINPLDDFLSYVDNILYQEAVDKNYSSPHLFLKLNGEIEYMLRLYTTYIYHKKELISDNKEFTL